MKSHTKICTLLSFLNTGTHIDIQLIKVFSLKTRPKPDGRESSGTHCQTLREEG